MARVEVIRRKVFRLFFARFPAPWVTSISAGYYAAPPQNVRVSDSLSVRLYPQTKREVAAYTKRGKGYPKQDCGGATVRNSDTARPKKRPFSEATQVKDSRDRYDPMQIADIPDLGT